MTWQNYLVIMLFTSVASIYSALSARFSITKVPWLRLLKNPDSLGGWKSIRLHAWWVFVWVLACCAVSTVLICTIQLGGTPLAKKFYAELYHQELAGSGEIHLIGYIVIAVLGHLFLARKTYLVVRRKRERMPRRYVTNQPAPFHPLPSSLGEKLTELGRTIFYSVPKLLAPIYIHFYDSTGPIIETCACLLINSNPENTLVEFYQYHRKTNPAKSDLLTLNRKVDSSSSVFKPHIIATGVIRIYGFHAAERYIENYKRFIQKKDPVVKVVKEVLVRQNERATRCHLLNQLVCSIAWKSGSGAGRVVEVSKDGSGTYITHSLEALKFFGGQQVVLSFENIAITGTSVHDDEAKRTNGDSYGVGLHIKRKQDQLRFAAVIDAHEAE